MLWSALIVSITALLYLAMILICFLPESDKADPSLDNPINLSIKENEK